MSKKIPRGQAKWNLEQLEKDIPNLRLISHIEFGRLSDSTKFPYGNKPRLYREITEKILQVCDDFPNIFERMPISYKYDILLSPQLNSMTQLISSYKGMTDMKDQSEKPEKMRSFILSYNYFTTGIEGLIASMPQEFRQYLEEQIKPILQLMQSIAKFSQSTTRKQKVPFVKVPKIPTLHNIALSIG